MSLVNVRINKFTYALMYIYVLDIQQNRCGKLQWNYGNILLNRCSNTVVYNIYYMYQSSNNAINGCVYVDNNVINIWINGITKPYTKLCAKLN